MIRPLCKTCKERHASVNYKRKGKTYYRTECGRCLRLKKKQPAPKPNWALNGYIKKMTCDLCGFKAKWGQQIVVYYIDGDMRNTKKNNLRSVCLNCTVTIDKKDIPWATEFKPTADF